MKILLNAFDSSSPRSGPFPNLALMKLAEWHKANGDEVGLIGRGLTRQDGMPDPDIVYVSVVFDWNAAQARGLKWMHPGSEFHIGGSGLNLTNKLPDEIEALLGDEEIYNDRGIPGWPYAIGFSSRGCNRKCPFCVVPKKEGRIKQVTGLARLVRDHERLLLIDNNIMQDAEIYEKLRWLAYDWGGRVNFNQGIDARIIAENLDLCRLLADVNFAGRSFNGRILTSAYDYPQYSKIITRAVKNFESVGIDPRQNLQFYVLINWSTTFAEDLGRIQHLKELGTMPYVMIYDRPNCSLKKRRLARWANAKQLFWSMDWEDYDLNIWPDEQ